MPWTDEMVEDLKKMWKEGLSTGEIGKRLGVSKNSIVGKVHRLQLDGRPSPIKKKEGTDSAKPAQPKPAEKAPTKAPAKASAKSAEKPVSKPVAQPEVKPAPKQPINKPVTKAEPPAKPAVKKETEEFINI